MYMYMCMCTQIMLRVIPTPPPTRTNGVTGGCVLGRACGHIRSLPISHSHIKGDRYWRLLGPICLIFAGNNGEYYAL